jgi:hypothetical protein
VVRGTFSTARAWRPAVVARSDRTLSATGKCIVLGELIDLGSDFWSKDRRRSGQEIDVIRGQNIPANSKAIDRTIGMSGVVSHKSTDLRCKSYRSPSTVYRLGMSFVDSIARYKGEIRRNHKLQATYFLSWAVEQPDANRVLEWFIPVAGVSAQQESALARVVSDGAARGVDVKLFRA